jgi:hypothetical protein
VFSQCRATVIAGVTALGLVSSIVSSAAAAIRQGHYHADVGGGATKQNVDLFVSSSTARIGFAVKAHCSDNSNVVFGNFSEIDMKVHPDGRFSFKRTQRGSVTRITGKLNGSTAIVRIQISAPLSGATCKGATTFHARWVNP